ncbi:hypothetical protein HPB47_009106 [Ixodes persulcatus]|uniref:Uncharacterized protein n=1 Tax=Ixodes persulcatus TaxID=34615 RepID=A0AC60P2Y5_IXOPE|nr:hypothetical protein HPB47_009106 [Ixodes persulcatus]
MTSSYYRCLPSNDRVRYEQKLTCLGGCAIIDPFDPSNAGLFNEEQRLYPQVTWPELHDYLINTPGLFTLTAGQKESKAYDVWVAAEQSGPVLSAHCTCVAG